MKKCLMVMLLATVCLGLTGCAKSTSDGSENASDGANIVEEKKDETEAEDTSIDTSESGRIYSSGKITSYIEDGWDSGEGSEDPADNYDNQYEEEYVLQITGNNTAVYTDTYYYHYGLTSISRYEGTFIDKGNYIQFNYGNASEGFIIYVDGDKITSTEYLYDLGETKKLVGTYEGKDDVYGDMTLTVDEAQNAILSCTNGMEFAGYISYSDNKWELYGYYDDDYFDWYIYTSGNTFTHETYRHARYSKYESENEMVGDLGSIILRVDDEGNAYTELEIDGSLRIFVGSIDVDDERGCITNAYLSTDDGYTLNLYIETLYDGTINYSGSLTTPLGAG